VLQQIKVWAGRLKAETYALYLAARDPRTPWYARLLVAGVVAYALSPFDLVPDFIPVIGYLDDLLLLPLGIALAIRLIPDPVLRASRLRAQEAIDSGLPASRSAGICIAVIWLLAAALLGGWLLGRLL
jgi:uncharacterized membrane protein YkvA (DUF1232 family)